MERMIADGSSDGNWKDPRAHVSEKATYRSALYPPKAEERRLFGYMRGHLEAVRHVLPVSDWLDESRFLNFSLLEQIMGG